MEIKICKKCGEKIEHNSKFCSNCGSKINKKEVKAKNKEKDTKVVIIVVIVLIICFITAFANSEDTENNKTIEYSSINPQIMHSDYIDNEISAKDKYTGNYYYFTGTIYDIEQFLNDNYLTIRYVSERDSNKYIEITAYFNNPEDLKSVKKGDTVTVYGKFKQRSMENYMNIITLYSFENCSLNGN